MSGGYVSRVSRPQTEVVTRGPPGAPQHHAYPAKAYPASSHLASPPTPRLPGEGLPGKPRDTAPHIPGKRSSPHLAYPANLATRHPSPPGSPNPPTRQTLVEPLATAILPLPPLGALCPLAEGAQAWHQALTAPCHRLCYTPIPRYPRASPLPSPSAPTAP